MSQTGKPNPDDSANSSPPDVTPYQDRPSDDGKQGAKGNRKDAPAAQSSLGNFAGEDLEPDHPVKVTDRSVR